MKLATGIAFIFAGCLLAMPACGQKVGKAAGQNQQQGQPTQQPKPQDSNPFPTDTTNVPVMPSRENPEPDVPSNQPTSNAEQIEDSHYAVPAESDPVASPDNSNGSESTGQFSSSNTNSLDSILPTPGEEEPNKTGKKGKRGSSDEIEDKPKETAESDISVAKFYLDNKNWRAALSRYQSALVLAPEDPEVYWGLAVSQQHMGDYANARANYEKVIEYDPDSKHAKDAKKALKEPELANAKPAPAGQAQK